ncbi:MAG: pantetheine-phosphate adenylyltransferase [Porphyromonadaceae bacterium]|nr:pantetheine-phosphate adenylyltransferase [Porphyromonadaceae bacterium]
MKTSETTAFYPGSFDPFTLGHESILLRALQIFDKVILAIGVNDSKHYYFTLEQRIDMLQDLYTDNPCVEVVTYSDLTVLAAQRHKATAILRGIRSATDFEYEKNLADINRSLTHIDTVFFFSEPQYSHISSSMVRELLRYNYPVESFIPQNLKLPKGI